MGANNYRGEMRFVAVDDLPGAIYRNDPVSPLILYALFEFTDAFSTTRARPKSSTLTVPSRVNPDTNSTLECEQRPKRFETFTTAVLTYVVGFEIAVQHHASRNRIFMTVCHGICDSTGTS